MAAATTHRDDGKAARNRAPLDALSFFVADVKDGIGPFLAIYLLGAAHWDASRIGIVLTIGGVATVLMRGPAGALIDGVRWKRSLIAAAAVVVAAACVVMAIWPQFWPIAAAQAANGSADAVFPGAIAAISLGVAGRAAYTARVGRNEAFNHAGNAATAIATGVAGYLIDPSAVLWIGAALATFSVLACFRVRGADIDHHTARGADDGAHGKSEAAGMSALLRNRPLLMFTAAITLFHFANAAMLPLLGEKLAQAHRDTSTLFMASCIITAQIVMVPMAILVGHRADAWGRKVLFLAGFAALPIRGVLYTLLQDPFALVAVQILDGVGAGIFGALFFIVVADLTEGTGRYNLALGLSSASWGLGAALSNAVAGFIVSGLGYDAAFLFLSGCAAVAFVVFLAGVPETRGWMQRSGDGGAPTRDRAAPDHSAAAAVTLSSSPNIALTTAGDASPRS